MKTPSNRLLVSLSLADLLMMSKSWVLVINMWNNGPVLGLPGKELILTCFITCLLVSCAFIRLLGPLFYSNYCVLCYLFRVPFLCKCSLCSFWVFCLMFFFLVHCSLLLFTVPFSCLWYFLLFSVLSLVQCSFLLFSVPFSFFVFLSFV